MFTPPWRWRFTSIAGNFRAVDEAEESLFRTAIAVRRIVGLGAHHTSKSEGSRAGYLRDWFAMGRRGQGQARRPADRRARYRRPLPGGQQRRPHGGHRRPDLQAVADSQRHSQPAACSASSPAAWCSTRPAFCKRSTAWSRAASRSART